MTGATRTEYHFIDSHLHLGDSPDPMADLRLGAASRELLVTNGTDRATSMKGIDLARANPDLVEPFVGVHPSEALREREPGVWLEDCLRKAAGLGEVGLDPKYSEIAVGGVQMDAFNFQLSLAEHEEKPVQVHSRGAEKECLEVLSSYHMKAVLLHWFEGEGLLDVAADRGYYCSFGPALLFSKKLQRMAIGWDRQKLLAESDSPVKFGALGAGGPWLIPSVAFKLSELLRMSFDETAGLLVNNGIAFLRGSS